MANEPREPKIFFGKNPDAGRQLRERLERLTAEHEEMKECNRVIRENASGGTYAQMDALMALGYSRPDAEFIMQPGDDGKPGYSRRIMRRSYTELHRLRRRLEEFEKLITKEPPPPRFLETDAGPVVISEKYEEYLLQFKFTRGVPEKTREILRRHGFHWSWESLAFQRALTDEARGAAEAVLEEIGV